jgi:hypothetical protein
MVSGQHELSFGYMATFFKLMNLGLSLSWLDEDPFHFCEAFEKKSSLGKFYRAYLMFVHQSFSALVLVNFNSFFQNFIFGFFCRKARKPKMGLR